MYAIIDVETTGLNARTEKITEIAIYIHDGNKIIDEFITLINPEVRISYQITALTGINNKMVAESPKFYEVAKQIVEITEDKIIVGHNVNFDYGFIRHEFKRLGYDFKRKTLCTCKLSRKAFPHRRSYGLGKLCRELNIPNHARHRASGDALATAILFEMIMVVDNDLIEKPLKSLNTRLSKSFIDKLPEATGVYYFHNDKGEVIYIGKSNNIKSRVLSHLSNNLSKSAIEMREETADITYANTGSELIALLLESDEIKKQMPPYNRAQRKSRYNWGLYSWEDDSGYTRLKIIQILEAVAPITSYASRADARNQLFDMVEKYNLCQKLCGLYESAGACFQYQIRECYGACVDKEDPKNYNLRINEALAHFLLPCQSCYIIDKGRNKDEKSVVKIENGKYMGFGYLSNNAPVNNNGLFNDVIKNYPDNKDVQQILRTYLRHKQVEKIIEF